MAKTEIKKGLEGVTALESSICFIDGENGKLYYRGYGIEDIVKKKTFEETAYLLWNGNFPGKSKLTAFRRHLSRHSQIPTPVRNLIRTFPRNINAMNGMRACISIMADFALEEMTEKANLEKAINILAVSPAILAAIERHKQGLPFVKPKKGLGVAANFLHMLHKKSPEKESGVLDKCLTMHAEHGLNASTFSARVTVATLSDLYSGVISAMGTLKGPLHGGANKKAMEMLNLLKKKNSIKKTCSKDDLKKIEKWVEGALKRKERIMGIGHRVYKVKDPRATILESYVERIVKEPAKYQIAKEIERIMQEKKGLYPNVDFFSGIVYDALGIPPDSYVCLFALARNAGWIAHILEQYSDNRLIRPRAEYVGKLNRKI